MSRYGKRRGGRVHPGEREEYERDQFGINPTKSDDEADLDVTLNIEDFDLDREHEVNIATTIDHSEKDATRKDYRNRLQRMVDWCFTKYNKYAAIVTRPVTEEELNDTTKHFHKQRIDFDYSRLHFKLVLAFLSDARIDRATGKKRSFVHVRKFHDAVLFGAREQGVAFNKEYHQKLKWFLESFRKECKVATGTGEMELQDADPMCFDLYTALCSWYVHEGSIFNWTYQVLLWNCMGRSCSVDPLGLHNFKLGPDSIVITYDRSKSDMGGERVHPKNCYANPYNPYISSFLALGVWFLLYPEQFDEADFVFIRKDCNLGSATKRFSNHLRATIDAHSNEVTQWGVPDRIKAHSARKGTATHLTAGTLNPPPLPSVAHRGEWSQGKVQDIYFNFAQPGDHYIGRMLAGLDPTSTEFRVLPPHFKCGVENADVARALDLCYGRILSKRQNLTYLPGIFLRLLASVVYHEQWLREILLSSKKHPFGNIFLLDNTELLKKLKEQVTTEPTTNMQRPTGIPTHIDLQLKMEQILENNVDFLEQLKLQSVVIQESVKKAIQENDILSGNVTMPVLTEKLESHHQSIINFIKTNTTNLPGDNGDNINNNINNNNNSNESRLSYVSELSSMEGTPAYVYGGKFWDVPKNFKFQKNPTRKVGWEYWLRGRPGHEMLVDGVMKKAPIKPYRKFITDNLPASEKNVYGTSWKKIFDLMEKAPGLIIPSDPKDIDDKFIEDSFNIATEYLKTRVSYIWELKNRTVANWTISTWSKHVSPGFINDLGNENDKALLETNYRCLPRKANRNNNAEAAPVVNNNNNNNNNNPNQNNNNRVSRAGSGRTQQGRGRGKRTNNTGGTRSIADLFATTFEPDPAYVEEAKTTTNEDSEVIDIDIDEENEVDEEMTNEETDQSNSNLNSTDPSLIVQLPLNVDNGTIPNASRTTAAAFTAAITTILEASEMDTSTD